MSILPNRSRFKKLFFIIFMLSIFCFTSITFSLAEDPVWWDNDWGYREQIIIVNVGSSVLNNFPAYVKVPYRVGMQKNYNDIRFTNADNTLLLDYEVESYDATHANVWIRIPELTNPNVSIWMYYGNGNAYSGGNPTNVWDSNYILVQHLEESSGIVSDSTSYGNNGIPQNVEQNVLGKINGSVRFNLDNSYIDCGNSQSLNPPVTLCLEAWANTSNNNLTAKISQKGDWDGYGIGQDKWQGWQGHIYFQDVGKISLDWGKKLPQTNTWYYIAVTYDGVKMNLYVDGEKVAETIVNKNPKSNNRNFYIGSDAGNQKFFKGGIDEIRMSNISRGPDWIKQTYVMVNNNSEYVGFGGIIPKSTPEKSLLKEKLPMDQISRILGLKSSKTHGGILYEE
ncbi:MAG TPA: DUF2341 domain-containing protein [Methanofastidiosum sp.]|nr:DUF2341 domain-containing protein [Methanofastidiosum sp.]HOR87886.1 DUF2341 domain-containing protein [Methanofastidiosum sp.]HPL00194.1 DUF2341 domain-containing protein [Methanofastidiosum sp.]